jgi:glycosyltransferase involved in cell wall biosynthesis
MNLLDKRVTLIVIGEGDELENLRQLVKSLNLEERVRFVSFMYQNELWRKFKEFDAQLVCSKTVEAFCLVALEAQAHGLPLMHARTGGLPDILGNTALDFDSNSYRDLAEKVNQLLLNREMLVSFSRMGLENSRQYEISRTRDQLTRASAEFINERKKFEVKLICITESRKYCFT